jgi:hypothetical protein
MNALLFNVAPNGACVCRVVFPARVQISQIRFEHWPENVNGGMKHKAVVCQTVAPPFHLWQVRPFSFHDSQTLALEGLMGSPPGAHVGHLAIMKTHG